MPQLSPYFTCSRAYLIGIQNYQHLPTLSTPIKDVDDLANCLFQHEFLEENVNVSINSSAADIENVVAQMLRESKPRDRVILYFAGHGIAREESDEPGGFLVPVNAEKNVPESFIEMRWLLQQLVKLKCKHFLLILDCCFAGAIRKAEPYRTLAFDLTKKLYREKFDRYVDDGSMVRQVLTSSSNEEALDKLLNIGTRDGEGSNSPFAYALLKLLNGRIESPHHFEDGIITTTRMYDHIDQALEKLRKDHQLKKMQSPYYFPLRDNIRGQFIFLLPEKGETVIEKLPHREIKNPYKGLSSFETKDSHLFFGRKQALKELCALYKLNKVLLISGASGVGKSSLIQAGFIPAVSVEAFTLRPGNIRGIKDYLETFATKIKTANGEFLLFADQFEEMVTICTKAERKDITDFIQGNLEEGRCKVIISIRSDFESQLKDNALIKLTQNSRFVIPPFSRDEIEDIIVQPASQAVIQIESEENTPEEDHKFINRIVDEVMQSPGSLPLLSFALQEWYIQSVREEDNAWVLKESYYKGIGGVSGALSTIIEKFSDSLKTEIEKECLKKLLLRMVSVEEGKFARKKVYVDELQFTDTEQTTITQQLLSRLIELRVITTNPPDENGHYQKIYYEPVHDSLLTSWTQLWEWINAEGVGKMDVYQQLTEDTKQWKNAISHKKKILWGERLELNIIYKEFSRQGTTAPWLNTLLTIITFGHLPKTEESTHHIFNKDEGDFIRHSVRKVNKKKSILYLIISFVALLSMGILLLWTTSSQNRAKYKAYALTTMADNIKETDNMQALRIMQKAFGLIKPDSILQHKMEEIWKSRGFNPFHIGPFVTSPRAFDNFISPSGKYIVFQGDSLGVFEFSKQQVINKLEEASVSREGIYFIPANDSLLIVRDASDCLTVWNFINDKVLFQRIVPPLSVRIKFSDNNVLIDCDKEIIWLQLTTFQTRSYFRPQIFGFYDIENISGFLDKDKLYFITHDSLHIHELTGGNKYSVRGDDSLTSVIASDKKLLLQSLKSIKLYHSNGKFINTIYKGAAEDAVAAFSPNGKRILLESKYAITGFKASLWNADGTFIRPYKYPSAKFSATGKYIMLLKWVKENSLYTQHKLLETLGGIKIDSSNGLLLTDNDQYLVTIPQLKVRNLKTGDTTTIKINHGITADSIKEVEEMNDNIYAPLATAYAGTLLLIATEDSKYLIMNQHYKDHILEKADVLESLMSKRKLTIYNFSTAKQLELLEGNQRGRYLYIPQSENFVYRDISFFQYWDLKYLSHFTPAFKLKNAQNVYNYLDTSKFFPPLDRKYEKF